MNTELNNIINDLYHPQLSIIEIIIPFIIIFIVLCITLTLMLQRKQKTILSYQI